MTAATVYHAYLLGYVAGLAKHANPDVPSGDAHACAFALGLRDGSHWQHGSGGRDPDARANVEHRVEALTK